MPLHSTTPRPRRGVSLLVASTVLATVAGLVPATSATAAGASTPATVRAAVRTTATPWAATWTTTLRSGVKGSAVREAQLRMKALGYWVGPTDGQFGSQTQQAVLAMQKTAGSPRTGVIGRVERNILTAGIRPQARTTTGSTLEIDLKRQLLLVVVGGRTRWAFNTSTGSGRYYYQDGVRHRATTPRGHFSLIRQIDAPHLSPLGLLLRPKFFYAGYAVHGSSSIPAYPASHGCVRVSNSAINYLWASGLAPIGRRVWVY